MIRLSGSFIWKGLSTALLVKISIFFLVAENGYQWNPSCYHHPNTPGFLFLHDFFGHQQIVGCDLDKIDAIGQITHIQEHLVLGSLLS